MIHSAIGEAKNIWEEYVTRGENLRQMLLNKETTVDIEKERKEVEKLKGILIQRNWMNLDQKIQRGLVALRCPPPTAVIKVGECK